MQKKIGKITTNKNLESQNDAPPGQFITEKFPVFSAFPSPKIDVAQWELSINQDNELICSFNWEEINSMKTSIIKEDFHCVTQWSRLQTTWKGYLTSEIFRNIKINSELNYVTISCYDGYTTNILKSDLMSEKTILAKEYENENLKEEHGFPLRLVVPHLYGWKSAKWIKEIQFTHHATPGFWEVRGYHMNGDPWKQERFS
jgi:DMSO/TMAO reductase YedYZ molybdopterin-dependent catalytic subunit